MMLKNAQYNKILREYDSRQLKARHDLDIRTKEVYEKIPELAEIDQAIVSNSVNQAKLLLSGSDSSVESLKETLLDLSMKKVELLIENGYQRDYLTPRYVCMDCKDTGYIDGEKCHCFKQAMVDIIYSQSNVKNIIKDENFDTFQYNYYSRDYVDASTKLTPYDNAIKVVEQCKSFIKNFDKTYTNILLYGNTGLGKTFLINCIAKSLLDTSHTVIYLTAFQLFDLLAKDTFKSNDVSEFENQLDYILDCDLLVIDDLGTELTNAFVNSRLYLLINERHFRNKSTIISTNFALDYLSANYSERIYSRLLSDYMILKLVGDDIRFKKALL
ncbi:ATP-binding protein [Anaeromicropila herbilytica]|uniref:DNA replication protein DnaC n=1 Tax=Anaeromicropila herbilytica TaxID=2785025 RepID=A0A7R7EHJ1_9FIRM|nr:ATP-binding protein [Anaeromicropila herbilytica]BCN28961.1 DNA replication protein DnaC [Anaeromicropila herbilytica]